MGSTFAVGWISLVCEEPKKNRYDRHTLLLGKDKFVKTSQLLRSRREIRAGYRTFAEWHVLRHAIFSICVNPPRDLESLLSFE